MGVYPGWVDDLLKAASLPTSSANEQFLQEWHKYAKDCNNNPIDISHKISGHSSNCKGTTLVGQYVQNYASSDYTRTAFGIQIKASDYSHLYAALQASNMYTLTGTAAGKVADDLGAWGSVDFANAYLSELNSTGGTLRAPQATGGWDDIRRNLHRKLPATLHDSNRYIAAARRSLARARKVGL